MFLREPGKQATVVDSIRNIDPNGVAQPSIPVSGAAGVRPGAFPRMELSGNQAVIAWTASGVPRVMAAIVDLAK